MASFEYQEMLPLGEDATTYRLLDGAPLSLISDGEHFTVSQEAPVTVPVASDPAVAPEPAPSLRLVAE